MMRQRGEGECFQEARARFSVADNRLAMLTGNLDELGKVGAFIVTTQKHDRLARSEGSERLQGCIHVGRLGIVIAFNTAHNAAQRGAALPVDDICASFQEKVADILCHNLLAAARDLGYKTLAVAGGVSANSGLRGKLSER